MEYQRVENQSYKHEYIRKLSKDFQILCLQETHLTKRFQIPNFNDYHSFATEEDTAAGVTILINKAIKSNEIKCITNINKGRMLIIKTENMIFVNIYAPPSPEGRRSFFPAMEEEMKNINQKMKGITVLGDFNEKREKFIDIFERLEIHEYQENDDSHLEMTFHGNNGLCESSKIDYILTNQSFKLRDLEIVQDTTDHNPDE
jgi:exonuclease III